jgi:hypothetical protein
MAGWVAAAVIGSSLIGASASKSAADTQAQAGQASIAAQQGMFDTTQKNIAPFLQGGQNAISQLGSPSMQSYMTHQFGPADLKAGLAPNYDFMLRQGQLSAERLGGAGGLGGNAQQSAQMFGQNYAGNAYQNAFNNYQTQRSNIFNSLYNIAGLGANAAVGQGNIAQQTGNSIGNTIGSIGAAQAGGMVGAANAITGGLGQWGGYKFLTTPRDTTGNYLNDTSMYTYPGNAVGGSQLPIEPGV